jgi:hypothetical protein
MSTGTDLAVIDPALDVLACAIQMPWAIDEINLQASDFAKIAHGQIWDAILDVLTGSQIFTPAAIGAALIAARCPTETLLLFAELSGRSTITEAMAVQSATQIRDQATRRHATTQARALLEDLQNPAKRPDEFVERLDTIRGRITDPGPTLGSRPAPKILDWHELFQDDEQDEEWILEPILPARRLIAIYSAPKVGKSLLVLEMAVAVANGTPFLGVLPDRPRRVLYVDYENDPRGDIRTRLEAMGYGPGDLDNLKYLSFPTMAKLDTPAGAAELMYAVDYYKAEIVVIDTISRAVGGEENNNDTWLNFYRLTGLALKQAGVALLRLDHTGKDTEKGQRGGSAKVGDVDAVWKLEKTTEYTFRLVCEQHRMPVAEKEISFTRITTPVLRHKADPSGWMAEADAIVAEVIAAMDKDGLPADAGKRKARESAKQHGVRASDTRLLKAIGTRRKAAGMCLQHQVGHPFGCCPDGETA